MSWKRILDAARRNGIPLIVTDPEGTEPMVILPLEQFEAMSASSESRTARDPGRQTYEEPVTDHDEPAIFRPENTDFVQNFPIESPISGSGEAPFEEQFFLEPLDDEKSAELRAE